MSPRPIKSRRHPNLETTIKETAWEQIAELGPAALNLRAIARKLGIATPSIYNYYSNRDALVTALVVEAFASLAASQAASIVAIPERAYAQRLLTLGLEYRVWAIAKPERYQLVFGTPIAGYYAPLPVIQPVARLSMATLMQVLQAAHAAGCLRPEMGRTLPLPLQAMFVAWRVEPEPADEQVQFLTLSIWGQVHGLVSLEIGHHYPSFIIDPGQLYRHALDLLVQRYLPHTE